MCKNVHVRMSFICMRIENYFYIRKNYAAHYNAIPRGNTQIWSKDMTQQQTRTTYFKYHYNKNLNRLLSKRKLPPHCLQELHPY